MFHLPPEPEMEAFITQFFSDTGALFPYIHQRTFLACYDEAKRSRFKSLRRPWMGLLNAVLGMAIATTADGEVGTNERAAWAKTLFQRSMTLCLDHMIGGITLETGATPVLISPPYNHRVL